MGNTKDPAAGYSYILNHIYTEAIVIRIFTEYMKNFAVSKPIIKQKASADYYTRRKWLRQLFKTIANFNFPIILPQIPFKLRKQSPSPPIQCCTRTEQVLKIGNPSNIVWGEGD